MVSYTCSNFMLDLVFFSSKNILCQFIFKERKHKIRSSSKIEFARLGMIPPTEISQKNMMQCSVLKIILKPETTNITRIIADTAKNGRYRTIFSPKTSPMDQNGLNSSIISRITPCNNAMQIQFCIFTRNITKGLLPNTAALKMWRFFN